MKISEGKDCIDAVFSMVDELHSLLDGAIDIVELWKPATQGQLEWKERWMKRAEAIGVDKSL